MVVVVDHTTLFLLFGFGDGDCPFGREKLVEPETSRFAGNEGKRSREELRYGIAEARDSVSETLGDFKEAASGAYESAKHAVTDFDWREDVRKRPLVWGLGALGVGLLVGYGISRALDREGRGGSEKDREPIPSEPHAYHAHPIIGTPRPAASPDPTASIESSAKESKPGPHVTEGPRGSLLSDRLQQEACALLDSLITNLSAIARQVLLPALIPKFRAWIAATLSEERKETSRDRASDSARRTVEPVSRRNSTYQPVLERDQRE